MRPALSAVATVICTMVATVALAASAGADDGTTGDPPVAPSQAALTTQVEVPATARWVRLLETGFDAVKGERRKVSATAIGTVATDVPDTVLVLHAELRCGPAGTAPRPATLQVVNIWRGRTNALTPEFTYTATAGGPQTCELWVRAGRPRPVAGAVGNQVSVLPGSFVVVDQVGAEVVEYFHPRARSHLVDRRTHPLRTVSSLTWTAAAVPEDAATPRVIAIRGWVSLTACTSASGSYDPVRGRQLCTRRHRSPNGGTVLLRTRVDQLDGNGRTCATTYIGGTGGRYVGVSRLVHHSSRSYAVNVALRSGCAPTLRVVTTLRWRSGASMMVHAQGTLLTATPIDLPPS